MRTLILILICAAFVAVGMLEARAGGRERSYVIRNGIVGLAVGLMVCWLLVYVVGIFDNWKYSLRG